MIYNTKKPQPVPHGYVSVYTFRFVGTGSVKRWNTFLMEGHVNWISLASHRIFSIPFSIDDIISPDPTYIDLTGEICKGMGIECEIIRRHHLDLRSVPEEIKDELKVWNCRLIMKTRLPSVSTRKTVSRVSTERISRATKPKLTAFLITRIRHD